MVKLYLEFTPIIVLGCLILLLFLILLRQFKLVNALFLYYIFAIAGLALFVLPQSYLVTWFIAEMKYSVTGVNTWEQAYFLWLYHNLFAGFWGISLWQTGFLKTISIIYGFLLTIISIVAIVYSMVLTKKNIVSIEKLISSIILSGIIAFTYLYLHERLFSAGKAITYIYPFMMILPVIGAFRANILWPKIRVIFKIIVCVWLGFQMILSLVRIEHAWLGTEYNNYYMAFNPNYRQGDWQIAGIEKAVSQHCSSLGVDVYYPGIYGYLSFVFGEKLPMVDLSLDRDKIMTNNNLPSCVILDQRSPFYSSSYSWLAQNNTLFLLKILSKKTGS